MSEIELHSCYKVAETGNLQLTSEVRNVFWSLKIYGRQLAWRKEHPLKLWDSRIEIRVSIKPPTRSGVILHSPANYGAIEEQMDRPCEQSTSPRDCETRICSCRRESWRKTSRIIATSTHTTPILERGWVWEITAPCNILSLYQCCIKSTGDGSNHGSVINFKIMHAEASMVVI